METNDFINGYYINDEQSLHVSYLAKAINCDTYICQLVSYQNFKKSNKYLNFFQIIQWKKK